MISKIFYLNFSHSRKNSFDFSQNLPSPKPLQGSPNHVKLSSSSDKRQKNLRFNTQKSLNKQTSESVDFNDFHTIAVEKNKTIFRQIHSGVSPNQVRDRNIISRSKSPVDSGNSITTTRVLNLKNSNDNLKFAKSKISNLTISSNKNKILTTELTNFSLKNKELMSSSPKNKGITPDVKKGRILNNGSNHVTNNSTKRDNCETKKINPNVADLKKNNPEIKEIKSTNTKIIDLVKDKIKPIITKEIKKKDQSSIKPTKKISEKPIIEVNLDVKNVRNPKKSNNVEKTNTINENRAKNSPKEELQTKQPVTDFACCTVQNIDPIIETLGHYCEENKIKFNKVNLD